MSGNPEFRKNLWLEFSPTRLLAMPILLCALFFLTWLTDDHAFGPTTRSVSLGAFVALCFLWGTHQAGESAAREFRERTWDWTRLSAIRPWPLAWGKLFGSTAYSWLGGFFCLLVHLLASPPDLADNGRRVALLVLGALLCQGAALLSALQPQSADRESSRSRAAGGLILAFFFVSPFLSSLRATGTVSWYGAEAPARDFTIASAALFLGWILVGIHGRLRDEFRMRTLPFAWCGFVAFLMFYVEGFARGATSVPPGAAAFATAALLAYCTVFFERKDPVSLRRLVEAGRAGRWRRVAEGAPCFVLTLPFVLAAAAAVASDPGPVLVEAAGAAGARALVLAVVAFLLRDVALVLHLNLGSGPRRADLFALLCLGALYGLFPGILRSLGSEAATALFWPRPEHWPFSLAGAAFSAAAMTLLAVRRWMERGGGGVPGESRPGLSPTERSRTGR